MMDRMSVSTITPEASAIGSAFHVMTKPIGPICNLDCRYCFYLEKEDQYPETRSWAMPTEVLERYIEQYIAHQDVPEVTFAWQGGEPTLLGVRFFERVIEMQQRFANGKKIHNALQTNGTLLDDEWGTFLAKHAFLVGLSIDGPRELHDHYRVDKQGKGSFDDVMRGIGVLKKYGVEFNTLTVVNRKNADHPSAVYRFLKEIGSGFMQFIPLVERDAMHVTTGLTLNGRPLRQAEHHLSGPSPIGDFGAPVTEWSVRAEQYGEFLCAVFDEWVRRDIGRVFVQQFDVALGQWFGIGSSICVFSPECGSALAIEHNGDVYACDHYVYPEYKRGNVMNANLGDIVRSPAQKQFGRDKSETLPKFCKACDVRFACNGECPKHRFITTPDGEAGLNYLCAAYLRFFRHVDPHMRAMAALLRAGRSPMEHMRSFAPRAVGMNDPCPCGSGLKYKRCCGAKR